MSDPLPLGDNLLAKYIWVVFILFWLCAGTASWALIYHWIKYSAVDTLLFKFMKMLYISVIVFLFFLSFIFVINI